MNRPHPVSVWHYLSRFFFLLIFPAIQAIWLEPFSSVAWSNLPGLIAVTGLAYFQYANSGYGLADTATGENRCAEKRFVFRFHSGMFFRRQKLLPVDSLTSVYFRTSPLLSAFGAARLFLDTPAGSARKSNLQLYLSRRRLLRWWGRLRKRALHSYFGSHTRIVLMAATWSNPASGLLLIGILLDRAGQILGDELSKNLYATVGLSYRLVARVLPPTVALLGWLLAFGWLAAFLRQIFRYGNFSAGALPGGVMISRGVLTRSHQFLTAGAVRAVSVRRTLLTIVLRLSSAYLHTVGSGKEKGDRSLLLAAVSQKELYAQLEKFYPAAAEVLRGKESMRKIIPPRDALKSFLLTPLLAFFAVGALFGLMRAFLPFFAPLALFLAVFPARQTILHVLAWKKSFLAVGEHYILASGYHKSQLFTAVIPIENLQCIVLRQNPFQHRFSKRCSVRLCIGTERGACFTLRHFRRSEVLRLL